MKISKNENTTIITDNNLEVIKLFPNLKIINNFEELKSITGDLVVFNDVLRYLKEKDKYTLLKKMKKANQHFINITSDSEEIFFTDYLIIYSNNKIIIEGNTASVLKEEKLLKRLGISLPFVPDLSIQLNYYGLIDKMYFDIKKMVDELW